MTDLINETLPESDHKLSYRFTFSAVSLIFILAIAAFFIVYFLIRFLAVEQNLNQFSDFLSSSTSYSLEESANEVSAQSVNQFGLMVLHDKTVINLSIYTHDQKLLWSSAAQSSFLDNTDRSSLAVLLRNIDTSITSDISAKSMVLDSQRKFINNPTFNFFLKIFERGADEFSTLSVLSNSDRQPIFIVKTIRSYKAIREFTTQAALASFIIVLISSLLVYIVFSRFFRKSMNVIQDNETMLNNQVTKLSMLLEENKQLQHNMKSASKRAVELNERFLRRVGADLHDGPAQSIGYSVLRLNQASSNAASEELGHEFYAIKDTLTESLNEIRGISSGLVLPELEHMSLEQAIHKVIQRHVLNTGIEVKETYLNLPEHVSLPIKICAYRFAQEGLNNAYNHGRAEKCRFTAQLIDDVLHLSLKDNGMGFRKSVLDNDHGHLGLIGMKDRIESLGGTLRINSELGVGTAVKVTVKISDDD